MTITLSRYLRLLPAAGLACLMAASASALPVNHKPENPPRIQLAILLDTSSSMDGLIDQTRHQLWQMVNEFAKAKKQGMTPLLEVAVYEYGNDNLPAQGGHIRQVTALTRELDKVSEALFALTTNGGNEFCGQAIDTALNGLQWSRSHGDIRAIIIAGNEPFNQGPVPWQQAVTAAKNKGITVNTIHAGGYDEGAQGGWKEGALIAGGNYMSIDHNHQVAHIVAPQDQKIAELNARLNQTYIPYGAEGAAAAERQAEQDAKNSGVSLGLLAQRVKSKVSALYDNSSWDLVDALESGAVKLDEVKPAALPEPMRDMDKKEQEKFIAARAEERKQLQAQIEELSNARDAYVAAEEARAAKPAAPTVSEALTAAVRAEGAKKEFDFK